MHRGFTLIELLVVIAIIAILAALLFPVFAASRLSAKRTAAISNTKQTAIAILLYQGDNEDVYPSAFSIDTGDGSSVATGHVTQSIHGQALTVGGVVATHDKWFTGIPAGANGAALADIDRVAWINATEPYRKSYTLTELPALPSGEAFSASVMASFATTPIASSLTLNGLLSTLSASSVNQPSRCPLVWPGQGKWNFRGGSLASPYLACDNTTLDPAPACRFNPGGAPQDGGVLAASSSGDLLGDGLWIYKTGWFLYGAGFPYVTADGAAHFVQLAEGPSYYHPFAHLSENGTPVSSASKADLTRCTTMTGGIAFSYLSWFRPDSEYSYPLGAQPLAGRVPCGW